MPESRTEGALKDETAWPVTRSALRARSVVRSALRIGLSASAPTALLVLGGVQGGCSAITATMECRDAARAVEHGVASGPRGLYQLTLARAYLEKAREEASEAHYGSAVSLARAAQQATERARSDAPEDRSARGRTE